MSKTGNKRQQPILDDPDQIEDLVVTYQNLVGKGIIDYERFTKMLITHHSTAIEGSTLTLGEM